MGKCVRVKPSDRNEAAVISTKDFDMKQTLPPEGGGQIIDDETLECEDPSSLATCTVSWTGASISLDSNIINAVTDAIDVASAAIGQVATQTTSLQAAIEAVVDQLIKLQTKSRRKLVLRWAFTCLVDEDSDFHVRHTEIITWEAGKVGDVKGRPMVKMDSTVMFPGSETGLVDLAVNHSSDATRPKFPRTACGVVFLAKGPRTSQVHTVLAVTLPPVSAQVDGIIKKLRGIVGVIQSALGLGYEQLKKFVDDLQSPGDQRAPGEPSTDPDAVELLKQAMEQYFDILLTLVGSLSGGITLHTSSLSFQAVTRTFATAWTDDKAGGSAIGSAQNDGGDDDEKTGDSDSTNGQQTDTDAMLDDELLAFLVSAELIDAGNGIVLAEDPIWPGRSKAIIPVRTLEPRVADRVVIRPDEEGAESSIFDG